MYFPEDIKKTTLTYMIYQVTMPLHQNMYIQYKHQYWHSLHSNHLHHSHTLQCWLHHCRNHCLSNPVELHSPDLHSIYNLCNIVYQHQVHSNHHHHKNILHYLFHHRNDHCQLHMNAPTCSLQTKELKCYQFEIRDTIFPHCKNKHTNSNAS